MPMQKDILYNKGDKLGPSGLIYLQETTPYVSPGGQWRRKAVFECRCGREFKCLISSVKQGNTLSCGCLENAKGWKHGLSYTRVSRLRRNIKSKCYNPKNEHYPYYGERGIKLYLPWINDLLSFYAYISNLPGWGDHSLSLDRIDNDGDYEPGNLRWATKTTQRNNQRQRNK